MAKTANFVLCILQLKIKLRIKKKEFTYRIMSYSRLS